MSPASNSSPDDADGPHQGQPLVTAGTPLEEADAALVLVHGRGATARSIIQLGTEVGRDGVALLAPQAAGNEWYPNSFLAPVESNEPGRTSGLRAVADAVGEATDAGVPLERVTILGFSQGGCLASEFVAHNPQRYGGLVALSGGLIGESVELEGDTSDAEDAGDDGDSAGELAGTPAFLGCSDADPHIPLERVRETTRVLEALGADVTERIYEGMGHGVNEDELAFVSGMVERLVDG
ncbi:alpha/beta hydrolase [Natrarchaeobius chitinivorans]|uniref:Phospholipase n=1 Tax=Natrarchaeobius chitinivorans TaxID=1679083 RepID=A0A3N6LVS1_NATCH|nr:dienelactone hydrolase family protein [Natrarchaeobius chitinivorans]RQG94583.1 phospholipase [Natrarchaeobius chitinivorans]